VSGFNFDKLSIFEINLELSLYTQTTTFY